MTLWTVAHQAPLSMGVSRQEYWSGLPFPSPGYLPNPGIEPVSPVSSALQASSVFIEASRKPKLWTEIKDSSLQTENNFLWLRLKKKKDAALHVKPVGWLTEPYNSLPVEEAKLYFYPLRISTGPEN